MTTVLAIYGIGLAVHVIGYVLDSLMYQRGMELSTLLWMIFWPALYIYCLYRKFLEKFLGYRRYD